MIATAPAFELRRFPLESDRAKATLNALQRAMPTFRPDPSWLVLWGPGAPNRFAPMREHLAAGGHVIALDLAYWHRETKFRVSIDAAHPQAWVMKRDWPASRFAGAVPVADVWNPDGPILIAGLGQKATVQYGADVVQAWELEMAAACRARWARPIVYRPKRSDGPVPAGLSRGVPAEIDRALRGASLVITWHSNVAVDAIRMGIPVICRDGAAAAVCPSSLPAGELRPLDPALRDRFLQNLAWFQWSTTEARAMWRFLADLLA